jgi:hypothetical protein
MGTLISSLNLSLDGFVDMPDGGLGWAAVDDEGRRLRDDGRCQCCGLRPALRPRSWPGSLAVDYEARFGWSLRRSFGPVMHGAMVLARNHAESGRAGGTAVTRWISGQ